MKSNSVGGKKPIDIVVRRADGIKVATPVPPNNRVSFRFHGCGWMLGNSKGVQGE